MTIRFELDNHAVTTAIRARRPALLLEVGDRAVRIEELPAETGAFTLDVDGRKVEGWRYVKGDEVFLRFGGRTYHLRRGRDGANAGAAADAAHEVLSEMPGTVIAVHAAAGATVAEGDRLLTIESMKLQLSVVAPRDGQIAAIHVAENATFDRGITLVSFVKPPAAAAGG